MAEGANREGYGAFVTDVTLEANVHWEGRMIVTWVAALVGEGDLVNSTSESGAVTQSIDQNTEHTGQANTYNVSMMETTDCENTFVFYERLTITCKTMNTAFCSKI